MRRRLLNLLTVVSLVLCVALAALWARSFFVCDSFDWETADGRAGFTNLYGRLGFGIVHVSPTTTVRFPRGLRYAREPADSAAGYQMKPGGRCSASRRRARVGPRP